MFWALFAIWMLTTVLGMISIMLPSYEKFGRLFYIEIFSEPFCVFIPTFLYITKASQTFYFFEVFYTITSIYSAERLQFSKNDNDTIQVLIMLRFIIATIMV